MISFRNVVRVHLPAFLLLGAAQFAQAQEAVAPAAAPDQSRGLLLNIPIFLALFGIFWFGIIRPQRQQQKAQNEFHSTLKKGDEVITAGGLIGTVVGITDRVVTLDISQGTEVKVLRTQVQAFLKEALPVANPAPKK